MAEGASTLQFIPLEHLHLSGQQPRRTLDMRRIDELATSIGAAGVLQPLLVRPDPTEGDRYLVVAGARRLEAARRLYESDDAVARDRVALLPCLVRDANDAEAFADALVENLVRGDLTRREMMEAVKDLKETYGWSVREIARRIGRSDHDLSELLRVISDTELLPLVAEGRITPTAAGLLVQAPNLALREDVLEGVRAGTVRTVAQVELALARARVHQRASNQPPPLRAVGAESDAAYQVDEHGRVLGAAPDAAALPVAPVLTRDAVDPHVRLMLGTLSDEGIDATEAVLRYGAEKGWTCADLLRTVRAYRAGGERVQAEHDEAIAAQEREEQR